MKPLLAILCLVSPFTFLANPFCGVPGTDSSIFIHVARGVGRGLLPYRDVFDQKGPLLYFIDALGWACGGVSGIWLFDIVAFCLALWVFWRIAAVAADAMQGERTDAMAAVCASAALYHLVACGGNMPEMWIAVLAGMAWYWAVEGVLNGGVVPAKAFLMGVCVGCILMLKFNMIGVALPVAIACLAKRPDRGRNALAALAGAGVVVLPILGWFAWRGGLASLWEVYVRYNAQYARAMSPERSLRAIVTGRAFWPVVAAVAANAGWTATSRRDEGPTRRLASLNLSFLLASFALILASGGTFRYYGPVLPACVLPFCFLFGRLKHRRAMTLGAVLVCVVGTGLLAFTRNYKNAEREKYAALRVLGETAGVVGSDRVMVLGCDCHAYGVLEAWCPSRFMFQGTVGKCSERYRADIIEEIRSGKIQFVVVPGNVLDGAGFANVAWAKEAVEQFYRRLSGNAHYAIWVRKDDA